MQIAKIKVVGVGGGGSNMIEFLNTKGLKTVETTIVNTDFQALETSSTKEKIQIGIKSTKGLGAGMIPAKGMEAAEENYDDLKEKLKGYDIVFIATGLGGGTGTGAAPIIAKVAKEVGALTIGVVTKPFLFEGKKRMALAEEGLSKLKEYTDSIIVIPNNKLTSIIDSSIGIKDAFKIVDEVLAKAVIGISDVIQLHGTNDVNLDFADVKTIMEYKGIALMGIGESKGENAAFMAIEKAVNSPLLEEINIDGAMGILVNFYINPKYPLLDITNSMNLIYENVDENANVMFGTTTNESIPIDEVKVTIIATGFEKNNINKNIYNNLETMKNYNITNVKELNNNNNNVDDKLSNIRQKLLNISLPNHEDEQTLENPSYKRFYSTK